MRYLFRLAIAIVLIGVLVWLGDGVAAHWEIMTRLSIHALVLAMLAITAGRTVMAYKWLRLLRCRGAAMSLRTATQVYCAANVWGLFLPATIGADAVRTVCASREGLNGHTVVASMLVERGIGFIISSLLCLLAVLYLATIAPLGTTLYFTGWFAAAMLAGVMLALWLSFTESIYNFLHDTVLRRVSGSKPARLLRELHDAYREYAHHRRELAIFSVLTVVEAVVTAAAFWILAVGLEIEASLAAVLAAMFLANLAARIPLSVGGFGVFEAMFVLALMLVGVTSTEALSIALLGQILKILSWLPWWFSYTLNAGSFSVPGRDTATEKP
ncbi:MAG: lysylphosphatidylglycerol synthase transmembrane domain-containing protein [Aquisalimonadaceae bacterium]